MTATIEHLSPTDASMLAVDDPDHGMHIQIIHVLEGEPPTCDEFEAHLLPDSRLVVGDAIGHCPMLGDPERFDELVTAFVTANPGNATGGRRRAPHSLVVPNAADIQARS